MTKNNNKFTSRKFILTVLITVLGFGLFFADKVDFNQFLTLVSPIIIGYLGLNVAQKLID